MLIPRISTALPLALLGLCALACKKKGEEAPVQPPAATSDANLGDADQPEGESDVHVDDEIAELCDMPTPNFKFDSAKVGSGARAALDALAECFISGPAKGKELRLVGHADPRGDEEYNFALGQRRAAHVEGYLEKKGLPSNRIETSSRGELDAVGADESGWVQDRRVDIKLAS
jgi:peptidoglycan-associated lipoprotein